ncbi:TetR/AcrR family transcriptional regulator [Acinetobacter sp. 187]|uniref:TetR/AcrR family transcriptional regulator n=1 Tax=Acinetobacter lanii TaxID=2715163 RepID=A0A6G8S1U0_9GAMM|nr:TetR/AcrR family transcriptional regulator [Acinetobacter lanii]NHC04473.1 TetR/AcrR family transcriptional regulator [Acinetobacter lanii]QIO08176.1 TetR/AcrR family transcriptional regulator [Acinetobacter lanii]
MNSRQQLASQNREELLAAAIQVFRVHGINAPLQLIIDEAKVGRATFYRNFADRRELVIALMKQSFDRLEQKAKTLAQFDDGFIQLIQDHIYNIPYLTALVEYWRVIVKDDPSLQAMYQRRDEILQPLIDKAIATGHCRADFTTRDYSMVTSILRSSLQGYSEQDQLRLAKRAVELLLNGIKA